MPSEKSERDKVGTGTPLAEDPSSLPALKMLVFQWFRVPSAALVESPEDTRWRS